MAVDAIRDGSIRFSHQAANRRGTVGGDRASLSQQEVLQENDNLRAQLDMRFGIDNIIGRDPKMLQIFDMIESIADSKTTVLITGESGTGKSLIARAVHRRSGRASGPFVEVACGALPENLLESELFGHVAGAFTGATGDKMGKFKQADGGTIFLDEIGTASPAMQVKLLRVLQELQFEPVGGNKTETVDVRIILATNEDLAKAVEEGRFRQDLYYRVNVINIELPPLRERLSDIPLLAQDFLREGLRRVVPPGPRVFRRGDAAPCNAIAGREMFANCRTSSSGPCCWAKGRSIGLDDLSPEVAGAAGADRTADRQDDAQTGPRGTRAADHPRRSRNQRLESQRDGRHPGHQPHDALQKNEATWARGFREGNAVECRFRPELSPRQPGHLGRRISLLHSLGRVGAMCRRSSAW